MIDQSLVQSGFDAEVLLGERYIRYLLLSSVEAGSLPLSMTFPVGNAVPKQVLQVTLWPPVDYDRVYTPVPEAPVPAQASDDSFAVTILFDHPTGADLKIAMLADVFEQTTGQGLSQVAIELFTTFTLETDTDEPVLLPNARCQPPRLVRNARISIALVDIDSPLLPLAVNLFGVQKSTILQWVKSALDRTIRLGVVGENQNLQNLFMQKLAANGTASAALGVYLNLRLRNGPEPECYFGTRGDIARARNFLPAGDDIAFGMPSTIYQMLGTDAFQRQAEETSPGSGDYRYPIHANPADRTSPHKGKIHGITVGPVLWPNPSANTLHIRVHGEYSLDDLPDPDFNLHIYVKPKTSSGLVTWQVSHDVDLSPFFEIASVLLAGVFTMVWGGAGLLAGSVLTALVAGAQELIVEPIATKLVGEKASGALDASLFDAIPHRITTESKRWDPFYVTRHEVVAKTDGVQVSPFGLGFSGRAVLDREADPVDHLAIRTQARSADGVLTGLWYRVRDFADAINDFTGVSPGTDRLTFRKVEGDVEPDLVELSVEEIGLRISQSKLYPSIVCVAKKVNIVEHQVAQILVLTQREISEASGDVLRAFKDRTEQAVLDAGGPALRQEAIDELTAELGAAPSEGQIDQRVMQNLAARVEAAATEYTDDSDEYQTDLAAAVETRLRFDLPPEEMAAMQRRRVLLLSGFETITMHRGGGTTTYFRDHPDSTVTDNLMSLPRYRPTP